MDPEAAGSAAAAVARKRQRVAARPTERPAYPRKRAAQACHTCRLRRTKCDNGQPSCASCVDLGTECVYQEKDKSTFDLASLAILQRLDGLEELIRSGYQNHPLVSPRSVGADEPSPLTVLRNIGSPTLERTETPISYQINVETILSWPVFQGPNAPQNLDLKHLLQPTNPTAESLALSDRADFEVNDPFALLDRFIETVHIYNPVLQEAKIRKYIQDASFNGFGWDAKSCLLLLIYALGAVAAPPDRRHSASSYAFRGSESFRQSQAYFRAAQKRMGSLLCTTGVLEAQCFFLAGVYLMNVFQPIEAWRMFVQALSCCQSSSHEYSNDEERHLQESIYWTCFKSELELRLNLNLAKESVWDLTYPAFFPSPPTELKTQNEVVWYFYLAEIALRRLGNRLLNFVYKLNPVEVNAEALVDATLDFEEQATGWRKSLPPSLRLDNTTDPSENSQAASLRFILHGHLLDCYEIMYWPFIANGIHQQPPPSPSSPATTDFVRKGLQLCVDRIDSNERGFCNRHHGTWFMLRSCTRSALVLLAAAKSRRLDAVLPAGWADTVAKVVQLLRYWGEESRDCADRLRLLEAQMLEFGAERHAGASTAIRLSV